MLASVTRRFNTFLLVLLVLMAASIIAILASRAGAGPLDPPGPPASTGRNLIFEPASCSGFPIVISQPGAYALASNITLPIGCTFKDGIDISASNVELDLGGFTVTGLASNSGSGIVAGGSTANLRLTNGIINTWSGDAIDFSNASDSAIDHVNAAGGASASSIGIGTMTVLSDCETSGGNNGVAVLGSDSTVRACDITSAGAAGVWVGGSVSGALIAGNHVAGVPQALYIAGNNNVITDNTAQNGVLPHILLNVAGTLNIAFRNAGDSSADLLTGAGGNDLGPFGTAQGSTSPWANIAQ